jgi:hypothetical protein
MRPLPGSESHYYLQSEIIEGSKSGHMMWILDLLDAQAGTE